MHRRRPGRHAHRVCLPVSTALLGLALVTGCSNSGEAAPTSTPPPTSRQPVSTPPTTPSQTPVGLPVAPSPTPIKRTLRRPPGAKIVDLHTCGGPIGVMAIFIKNEIFGTSEVDLQLIQLAGAGRLARSERKTVLRDRKVWLRDGYPASFPVVRELDTYIDIYNKIIAAAKHRDLNPLPNLYLRLEKVDTQYAADTGPTVCEQ